MPYEDEVPCKLIAASERRATVDSTEIDSQSEGGEDCSLIDNVFSDSQPTVGTDAEAGGAAFEKKTSKPLILRPSPLIVFSTVVIKWGALLMSIVPLANGAIAET